MARAGEGTTGCDFEIVLPGFIPGIQTDLSRGARPMDPGNKCRDDIISVLKTKGPDIVRAFCGLVADMWSCNVVLSLARCLTGC